MAITSIEDLDTEPKYTESEDGARMYSTRHLVTTDDPDATKADLLTDVAMPVPHVTVHAGDVFATCRTRALQPWENAYQWYLTIKWSTHREAENEDTDPFGRAVTGGLRAVDKNVPIHFDVRGILTANDAGDLYKGLTAVRNIEIIDVKIYSTEWPNALRSLNNTVNDAMVSMFGEQYAPRTLWMKNLKLPDVPTEQYGTQLWLTTFEAHHDPQGYYRLLPNAGLHELQYWTRTEDEAGPPRTFNEWTQVSFTAYEAEADDDLKEIRKERIETPSQQNMAHESWLDENGSAVDPTFVTVSATAAVADGSKTVTLTGDTITDAYVGTLATITFTDQNGKAVLVTIRIDSVGGGGTTFTTTQKAAVTESDLPIQFAGGGARFNYFELQYQADWSAVPLPAVPPVLGN